MQRGVTHQVLVLEPDFGVTNVNYRLLELLSRGGTTR